MPFPRRRSPLRIRSSWAHRNAGWLILATVSYVPLLLTHRGKLGADTKTYLYTDPARLLSRAPYLWDPSVGLGTVTHQNIGYLFPMGPYYWLMDLLRVPDWIAQRIWMGSILFLAGLGVRYLLRTLNWRGPGITVASFAYALSPYLLHYIYKHSVILLPFTALPWLIATTALALRRGGWRAPSAFALIALASGGVNATSLLLVLVGPVLWVLHAVWVERELPLRRAIPPLLRIGLLTGLTSLWWMAGLLMQGSQGIDVLRFTETYKTVAAASTGPEVFRGLGYWFFYGTDALGPWFKAAVTQTQSIPALMVSFAVPILAVTAALLTRFRYRLFFVGLAGSGLVISVGAHPFDDATAYGRFFKALAETSSGLALRSTPRALPLWALAAAVFLGAGVAAVATWRPKWRAVAAYGAIVLVIANLSPLWQGRLLDPYTERDVTVPNYWRSVGSSLDRGDQSTRAVEVPGIDFAMYRWGASVDTILPGVTNRDTAGRELVPWGSVPSADLTNAVDAGFQDASFNPSGYAALLRNLSAGSLVVRNDLQFERYRVPRPSVMTRWIRQAQAAAESADDSVRIGAPTGFGSRTPNVPTSVSPMVDATALAQRSTPSTPAKVETYPVTGTRPVVSTLGTAAPTIVAGSGDGLVGVANAGLLRGLTVYSGDVSDHPSTLRRMLKQGASLVITDTNRKAAHRWGTLRNQLGATELATERPAKSDPSDSRLDLFGRLDDTTTQTVAEQDGGLNVTASDYGNQLTYTAGDRAVNAFDGDDQTGWKVGAFSDVRGEWIQAESTDGTITADSVQLLQAQRLVNRHITQIRLTFDDAHAVVRTLDESSLTGDGQRVTFPKRTFRSLRIEILETNVGRRATYLPFSGVGFQEIGLDGRTVTEVIRPPTDLLKAVGAESADHPLTFIFRRQREDSANRTIQSTERSIRRRVEVPTDRTFTVSGRARVSDDTSDSTIDELVGTTGSASWTSSSRLAGDPRSRASRAADADATTAWQTDLGATTGAWIQATFPTSTTATISSISIVDDDRHSPPTTLHWELDGARGPTLNLAGATSTYDRTTSVRRYEFEPVTLTGTAIRLVVDEATQRTTPNWFNRAPIALPIAVTDLPLQVSGTRSGVADAGAALAGTCRDDLVALGSTTVSVQITGDTAAALDGDPVTVTGCGPGSAVASGTTTLTTTLGRQTGWDLDELVLSSPADDGTTALGSAQSAEATASSTLTAHRTSRGSYDLTLSSVGEEPFWLVLGQSINDGWHLRINGRDLGAPTLVNGYANGWYLQPADLGLRSGSRLTLSWEPQRIVWWALGLSGLAVVGCLYLLRARFAGSNDSSGITPMQPVGISPWDQFGESVDWRSAILVAATTGGATAVFAPMFAAPAVAAVTFVALRTRWGWSVMRVATVGLLGMTAAYVVARQAKDGFAADFDWPQHFEAVTHLPVIAFCVLGAESMVEVFRGGWRRTMGLDD